MGLFDLKTLGEDIGIMKDAVMLLTETVMVSSQCHPGHTQDEKFCKEAKEQLEKKMDEFEKRCDKGSRR